MRIRKFAYFLTLPVYGWLIASCEFEPTLLYEPERDLDRPDPRIIVHELSFETDTIFMYKSKLLSFNLSSENEEILQIIFLLDNREIKTFEDTAGSVGLNHEFMSPGPHKLEMEIYTTSGTGSIADQLHDEIYVFSKEWVLQVEKNFRDLHAEASDGFLKFTWYNYRGYDLRDYRFEIEGKTTVSVYQPEYIHKGHIGNREDFRVWTRTTSGDSFQWGYEDLDDEIPGIQRSQTDSGTYYIHWDKPLYYNAIERIDLWERIGDEPYELVKSVTDMNDRVYHVRNVQHGQYRYYYLKFYGKYPRHPADERPANATKNESYWFGTDPS